MWSDVFFLIVYYGYSGVRPTIADSVELRDNPELDEERAPNTRFYRFLRYSSKFFQILCSQYLADPGKARGCSANSFVGR